MAGCSLAAAAALRRHNQLEADENEKKKDRRGFEGSADGDLRVELSTSCTAPPLTQHLAAADVGMRPRHPFSARTLWHHIGELGENESQLQVVDMMVPSRREIARPPRRRRPGVRPQRAQANLPGRHCESDNVAEKRRSSREILCLVDEKRNAITIIEDSQIFRVQSEPHVVVDSCRSF
jgi:hypothetical protein